MSGYFDMQDKIILITGDDFNIIDAIAEEFALEDARIALFSSDEDNCHRLSDSLKDEYDIDVIYYIVDLNDENNVEDAIKYVEKTFGKINILANTALRGSNEVLIDRLSTRNIYPLFQISKIGDDEDYFDMEDKLVVITGASGPIGVEIAKKFAVEGANLMLISDNIDKLNENVLIYKDRYDVSVDYIINTLDDEADVKDWLSSIVDAYGEIDFLVNAAGMGENKIVVDGLVSLDKSPLFCIVWLQEFKNL